MILLWFFLISSSSLNCLLSIDFKNSSLSSLSSISRCQKWGFFISSTRVKSKVGNSFFKRSRLSAMSQPLWSLSLRRGHTTILGLSLCSAKMLYVVYMHLLRGEVNTRATSLFFIYSFAWRVSSVPLSEMLQSRRFMSYFTSRFSSVFDSTSEFLALSWARLYWDWACLMRKIDSCYWISISRWGVMVI